MGKSKAKKAKRGQDPIEVELAMIPAPASMTPDDAGEWLAEWAAEYLAAVGEGFTYSVSDGDSDAKGAFGMLLLEVREMIHLCAHAARERRSLRILHHESDVQDAMEFVALVLRASLVPEGGEGIGDAARAALAGHLAAMLTTRRAA